MNKPHAHGAPADDMTASDALFDLQRRDGALVLSVPHAGLELPGSLAERLTPQGRALVDTDWGVPRLYPFAQELEATMLVARMSRYVVDLNRDPHDVPLYPGARTTTLCPTETFEGEPLYEPGDEPDAHETTRRREQYWEPYHAALRDELARVHAMHGYALLVDAHSIWGRLPLLFPGALPDVNLGTNHQRSCAPNLCDVVANVFAGSPYDHVVNGRFKGGYITRHHGAPERNVHALQIELNQHTYLVEDSRSEWDAAKATKLSVTLRAACETVLRAAERTLPSTPRSG
ncbi:MAG: N-formylglutamate deformylase [Candidatus Eremiobacteraeota bacterium]|nr:N-formylglutamate deformylase [Candidatus Eremiobacteraeota bacterium]